MKMRNEHAKHRVHRNFLYSIVVILLIFQIVSFTLMSLQVTKLNNIIENIKSYVSDFVTDLDVYQTAEEYKVEDMSNLL